MACLKPVTLRNPRYRDSDKSMFITLPLDYTLLVPCGKCVECRKSLARDWRARLLLEVEHWTKQHKPCYFVTFTLAEDKYDYWCINSDKPIRFFLENYRRKVGKSCRHFIITELGSDTHRLHYHGILFAPELSLKELKKLWIYGFSFFGYCSYRTATYVSKYILKPQLSESWYKPRKFVSPGLGKVALQREYLQRKSKYPTENDLFLKINGYKYAMPRYLRNKLYTSEFLRSLQYDRYFKTYTKSEFLQLLKFGDTYCNSVDDYLWSRELRYLDSVKRKQSVVPIHKRFDNYEITANYEFQEFDNWSVGLTFDEPF